MEFNDDDDDIQVGKSYNPNMKIGPTIDKDKMKDLNKKIIEEYIWWTKTTVVDPSIYAGHINNNNGCLLLKFDTRRHPFFKMSKKTIKFLDFCIYWGKGRIYYYVTDHPDGIAKRIRDNKIHLLLCVGNPPNLISEYKCDTKLRENEKFVPIFVSNPSIDIAYLNIDFPKGIPYDMVKYNIYSLERKDYKSCKKKSKILRKKMAKKIDVDGEMDDNMYNDRAKTDKLMMTQENMEDYTNDRMNIDIMRRNKSRDIPLREITYRDKKKFGDNREEQQKEDDRMLYDING